MRNKMNLFDFSKWLQLNKEKHLKGSEYFPYPLDISNLKFSVFSRINPMFMGLVDNKETTS